MIPLANSLIKVNTGTHSQLDVLLLSARRQIQSMTFLRRRPSLMRLLWKKPTAWVRLTMRTHADSCDGRFSLTKPLRKDIPVKCNLMASYSGPSFRGKR